MQTRLSKAGKRKRRKGLKRLVLVPWNHLGYFYVCSWLYCHTRLPEQCKGGCQPGFTLGKVGNLTFPFLPQQEAVVLCFQKQPHVIPPAPGGLEQGPAVPAQHWGPSAAGGLKCIAFEDSKVRGLSSAAHKKNLPWLSCALLIAHSTCQAEVR